MRRVVSRWESQPALDLRGSSWLRTQILERAAFGGFSVSVGRRKARPNEDKGSTA